MSISAHQWVKGHTVISTFTYCVEVFGCPFLTLTNNGLVYTTRFSGGGNGGRNGFESVLVRLGVIQKNSRPNHPTTCGKVERFQQTLKNWLRAQPEQPTSLADLDTLLDEFRNEYNQHRPHRSLTNRTPAAADNTRPHARTRVICLAKDLDIGIIDAVTGEILRTLTLDTTRTYQPAGKPEGAPKDPENQNTRTPNRGSGIPDCLATSQ